MKIGSYCDGQYLDGLRLIDNQGVCFVDETWGADNEEEWIIKEIPDGHEIIGLKASIDGIFDFSEVLLEVKLNQRLGFVLWKPIRKP